MGIFDFFNVSDINNGVREYENTPEAVLVDVRTPEEYKEGHIPGSKNIPLQTIANDIFSTVSKNAPLFVYCLSGSRSRQATSILKQIGYTKVRDIGGISSYKGKVEY